ncbi:MAG TPA: TOBE domain-containing protein, partial [Jatrophihabitantaceae bacterium]|nr:TOBE domain-containing protein [Jatrophihabitantaceae bacterium]
VANFIGATPMNLLDAQVRSGALDFGGFTLPVPEEFVPDVRDGDKVVYGVRPEYLVVSSGPDSGAVSGTVATVENLGVSVLVTVEAGDQSMGAVVPEADEPPVGGTVWLRAAPGRVLLYRGEDGELVGGRRTI